MLDKYCCATMKRIVFPILFAALLSSCGDSNQSTSYQGTSTSQEPSPPSIVEVVFDIVSFFSRSKVIKFLSGLKIINDANAAFSAQYNNADNTVHFATNNPKVTGVISASDDSDTAQFITPVGMVQFNAPDFFAANNLAEGNDAALQEIDEKLLNDYYDCTQMVLDSGEGNHVRMLETRYKCMETKGHNTINLNYHRIKHEKYLSI